MGRARLRLKPVPFHHHRQQVLPIRHPQAAVDQIASGPSERGGGVHAGVGHAREGGEGGRGRHVDRPRRRPAAAAGRGAAEGGRTRHVPAPAVRGLADGAAADRLPGAGADRQQVVHAPHRRCGDGPGAAAVRRVAAAPAEEMRVVQALERVRQPRPVRRRAGRADRVDQHGLAPLERETGAARGSDCQQQQGRPVAHRLAV